jgi:hypothetical protein
MKPLVILGIVLLVIGVIALGYQGITYITHDKVADIGPVQVTAAREHTIPLPPIVGAAALVGGLVLIVLGSRRRLEV